MSKLRSIFFSLSILFLFNSCVKEIILQPFELPDLVQSYVRKVECFDEHQTALIGTDRGVLLIYVENNDQVIFDTDKFPELNEVDWSNAQVLYSNVTQKFWVIQDSVFITLDRTNHLEKHIDRTVFNNSTKFYFSYTLSNTGDLYRCGYYQEIWAGSSSGFVTDLYIGIYKYLGNPNNTWELYESEMIVKSDVASDPNFVFTPSGEVLILTNPQFQVSSISKTEVAFTTLGKAGVGFAYETLYQPYRASSGALYGFDKVPDFNSTLQNILTSKDNENEVSLIQLADVCDIPVETQGIVKLIDWKEDVVRLYLRIVTNSTSSDKSTIAYILTYDVANDNCQLEPIASGDQLKTSASIEDLDVLGNTVYLGTRNGLFVYDLETQSLDSYINNLLEYYLQ